MWRVSKIEILGFPGLGAGEADNLDLVHDFIGAAIVDVDVVSEGENSIVGFCRPVGKEAVQEGLIATVEASMIPRVFDQVVECLHRWLENEDA